MASTNYPLHWRAGFLVSTIAVCGLAAATATPHAQEAAAALRDKAMDLAYNLDHEEALVLLRRGTFYSFAPYCWIIGVITIVWGMMAA